MPRVFITALLFLTLAGCTALPTAEKAGALGDAIFTTGKIMRDAIAANRTLAIKVGEENEAQNYLNKRTINIDDSPGQLLPAKDVAARVAALSALEKYGDALSKAVDQATVDKLEQAATNLGNAAAGLAVAAGPEASLILSPGIKVAGRIGGFLLGSAYAQEIRAIIVAHNSDVKGIATLLRDDIQGIHELIRTNAGLYKSKRRETLALIREDSNVDRQRLYVEYRSARQEMVNVLTLEKTAEKYDDVLKSLIAAHEAIAMDRADSELFLRRFVALSTDLSELLKTIRKEA